MLREAVIARARRLQGLYVSLFALLILALVVWAATGVNFFKFTNLLNVARTFSMLTIAAIGQTFVVIAGGLDLSVGEVISTTNVFAASFTAGENVLLVPVVLISLCFGAVVGLVNGLLVTKRHVPAFIATLGTSIIINGGRLMWTNGVPRGHVPPALVTLGVGTTLGVPNLFYVLLLCAAAASVVLVRTGYGRRLYAVGTNPRVALLSGIRSDRVVITSYVVCGVTAAIVGVLLGGYTGMSDERVGDGYELDTIAVAVLGGAAIGGGSGSVQGTVIGAVILLVLTNLSLLMHFPIQSQMLIKGSVIVFALWLNARRAGRT
ncbi:ABC transporter permease [Salinispira pacifica]